MMKVENGRRKNKNSIITLKIEKVVFIIRLPNSFGSAHKLSGKRRKPWRARVTKGWTPEGKQIYFNIGCFATRAEALEALIEYNKNPYELEKPNKLTFNDLFDIWHESQASIMPPKTFKEYTYLKKYADPVQNMIFKDIKPFHIQKIIDDMDRARPTKAKVKQMFSYLYVYAIKNELHTKNNALLVTLPPTEQTSRKPFSVAEIKEVMSKVKTNRHYEVVMILLFTGLRIQELLDMKIENVHLDKGIMIGGSKTKAGKNRSIPISKHIKPLIEKWYNPEHELLIQTDNGRGFGYKTHLTFWHDYIPNHRPHDTRHTFITLASHAELNQLYLKRIVGHASNDVTNDIYTHTNTKSLQEQMDKFDDYMSEKLCI